MSRAGETRQIVAPILVTTTRTAIAMNQPGMPRPEPSSNPGSGGLSAYAAVLAVPRIPRQITSTASALRFSVEA
jgi:hypothetical protein